MVKDGEELTRITNNEIEKFRLNFSNSAPLRSISHILKRFRRPHHFTVECRCGVVKLSGFQMFAFLMKHAERFGCDCERMAKTHQRIYMKCGRP